MITFCELITCLRTCVFVRQRALYLRFILLPNLGFPLLPSPRGADHRVSSQTTSPSLGVCGTQTRYPRLAWDKITAHYSSHSRKTGTYCIFTRLITWAEEPWRGQMKGWKRHCCEGTWIPLFRR